MHEAGLARGVAEALRERGLRVEQIRLAVRGGQGGQGGQGGGNFRRGIDEVTLQKIADMTGGKYYPAESASQLQSVFSSLPTNLILKHEATEVGFVFVGFGGLLAAAALLLGKAWRPLP